MLLNLLSNASKFTRDGTVTLSIHAAREGDAWRLLFEVADTGIGIDISGNRDIFRAYQQVQAVNGGTGPVHRAAHRRRDGGRAGRRQPAGCRHGILVRDRRAGRRARARAGVGAVRRFHPDGEAEPDDTTPTMPCPPDDALDQLILLADNGQLTDIEAWLGPYADEPDYAAFVRDVREHLDALDLDAIGTLAGSLKQARRAATAFDAEADAAGPA